ncbi:sphingosine-1-phosphate phosphatase 2 [Biomphalaria glabrata]|nr:sphingosine-1-phosphate phosphatase 2-like [Biomphalaria glabrata]
MTETLARWVRFLADPKLTAQFQRKCGIRSWSTTAEANGLNGSAPGNNNVEPNGKIALGKLAPTANGKVEHGRLASTPNGHVKFEQGPSVANGKAKHDKISSTVNGKINHDSHSSVPDLNISNGITRRNGDIISQVNASPESLNFAHSDGKKRKSGSSNDQAIPQETSLHYSIDNAALYWLFSFGASLGNELFYTLFFSACMWSFDSFVLRKTLILWVVNMYVGQVAKDIIKWPRPKSPPVVRLEERYELEYGMPSTHAMVGFVLPFGMLYYMCGRYEFSLLLGLVVAVTWCLLVCFSRIYLGMHSALDVIVGVMFSAFLMLVTAPCVDPLDAFIITSPLSMPVVIATCLALGLVYPRVDKWSTTRGDTTQALAVFSGIVEGLWLTRRSVDFVPTVESLPLLLGITSRNSIGVALLRQLIGVPIVYGSLLIAKTVILYSMSWFLNYDPKDPETKKRFVVELPYKYGQFFVSCSVGAYIVPLLFSKMNIARPGFYSETFSLL